MNRITRAIAGLTGALITMSALAACSGDPNTSVTVPIGGGMPTAVDCGTAKLTIDPSTLTASTPTVAVLGETGSGIAYYRNDVTTVLNNVVNSDGSLTKAHVLVNGVGGPTSAPDLAANVVLTGDGPNQAMRTHNLECKVAEVSTATSKTLAKAPTVSQPDAFGALNTLAGNLKGSSSTQTVNVVLLTPLLAKGGGVDLADSTTLDNPAAAINKLAAQGLIPDCKGWRLYGVGADRGLPDAQAAQLEEFWRQFALKCGGRLVAWTAHLTQFPVQEAIQAADTTQIPIHQDPVKIVATLGGDVTFDDGRSNLRSGAEKELQQVLQLAKQTRGPIVVDGYTDIRTTETLKSLNSLSTARADAVAAWLASHGVGRTRLHTDGHGPADLVVKKPTTAAEHRANRRVTVTLYRKAAA